MLGCKFSCYFWVEVDHKTKGIYHNILFFISLLVHYLFFFYLIRIDLFRENLIGTIL